MNWTERESELVAYLLDELDGAARGRLELAFVREPERFALVQAVEETLILEYLEGRLDASRRKSFESRYLTNGTLRERVREIAAFRDAARVLNRRTWFRRGALATAASVLAAVGLTFSRWMRPAESGAGDPWMTAQLTEGRERSESPITTVALPRTVQGVRFRLPLRPGLTPDSAVLGTAESPEVWRGAVVTAGAVAEVSIERGVLAPGDYVLEIFAKGEREGSYPFRLVNAGDSRRETPSSKATPAS